MKRSTITDLYFMEARSKLIDLAAFLDRVEHSDGPDDYRLRAFRRALQQLAAHAEDGGDTGNASRSNRAEETLLAFSDPTREPATQGGGKAAGGAWSGDAAN